jgi:fimbrial chaperone protein
MKTCRSLLCTLPLCAGLLFGAGSAQAGNFQVLPVQVDLGPHAQTETLTVRNHGAESTRFQVSVYAWNQGAAGEMELAPTSDVVFFPSMFELGPGEERKIRVGLAVPAGPVEKTYRVFVEELPPLQLQSTPGTVRVLTRMGMPIFVEPTMTPSAVAASPRIENFRLDKGHLSFDLKNAGSQHVKARGVRLVGRDATGRIRHDEKQPAWYLLAGGLRHYDISLPASDCRAITLLEATLEADGETATATWPVRPAQCRR